MGRTRQKSTAYEIADAASAGCILIMDEYKRATLSYIKNVSGKDTSEEDRKFADQQAQVVIAAEKNQNIRAVVKLRVPKSNSIPKASK